MLLASALALMMTLPQEANCHDVLADVKTPTQVSEWPQRLCKELSDKYEQVHLSLITRSYSVSVKGLSADEHGDWLVSEPKAGRVQLKWQAKSNSKAQVVLWVKVQGADKALVYTRDLSKDEMVSPGDVEYRMVDVAKLAQGKNGLAESVAGKIVTKNVKAGMPVLKKDVNVAPLVLRNSQVGIWVERETFRIKTSGVALGSAWNIGDEIVVQIANATQTVVAKVKGSQEVYIEI